MRMQTNGNSRGWGRWNPQGWGMLGSERIVLTLGCYYSLAPVEKNIEVTPLDQQIRRKQPPPIPLKDQLDKCSFFSADAAQGTGLGYEAEFQVPLSP